MPYLAFFVQFHLFQKLSVFLLWDIVTQFVPELAHRKRPIPIFIHVIKSHFQILLWYCHFHIAGRHHEFWVIDKPRAISVDFRKYGCWELLCFFLWYFQVSWQANGQLFRTDDSIAI